HGTPTPLRTVRERAPAARRYRPRSRDHEADRTAARGRSVRRYRRRARDYDHPGHPRDRRDPMTTAPENDLPRALVVDDERQMRDIVSFALETQGFTTVEAADAEKAWAACERQAFDVIVLDVMLPRASGISLCRRIRVLSDVPIILLTAKGEAADRVAGLEAGADDYVVKPFHPRELALRAMAVVRRYREGHAVSRIVNGGLVIDPRSFSALRDGERLNLTQSEFALLLALASRLDE